MSSVLDRYPFYAYSPLSEESDVPDIDIRHQLLMSAGMSIKNKQHFQEDVHRSTAPIKIIFGGNRSGKTYASMIETLIAATRTVPSSMREWYPEENIPLPVGRPTYIRVCCISVGHLNQVLLPLYRQYIPAPFLKDGSFDKSYNRKANMISVYRPGSTDVLAMIDFVTYTQKLANAQGPERDMLVYDEEPPHGLWTENMMRMATTGMRVMLSMTPTRANSSWAHRELSALASTKVEIFNLWTISNPFVKTDFLVSVSENFRKSELLLRLVGESDYLSNRVYGDIWNRKEHLVAPFKMTKEHTIYRGLDPHSTKPSTWLELAVDKENNVYVIGGGSGRYDTAQLGAVLSARAADRGYALGETICDSSVDSTNNLLSGQNVYDLLKTGIPALRKSIKSPAQLTTDIDRIRRYLSPNNPPYLKVFDTRETEGLITSMETMERSDAVADKRSGREKLLEGLHDYHACLRYAFQSSLRWRDPSGMEDKIIALQWQAYKERRASVGRFI